MKELLSALSSYNVFNYLLPGVVFVLLSGGIVHYPLAQVDIIAAAFLYYFVGMVISRFGSVIFEPVLKGLHFVRFANYKDFVTASKKDEKLALLSEINNTYRTFCSLFALLLLLKVYAKIADRFSGLKEWNTSALTVSLLILFLFSYRKQTAYVTKRIKASE